jgi:hypothetical protein
MHRLFTILFKKYVEGISTYSVSVPWVGVVRLLLDEDLLAVIVCCVELLLGLLWAVPLLL